MGYQSNQRKPKPHQQKSRIQSRMAKCPVWLPCPIRSVTFVQTALWTEFPFIGEDFPNWNRSSPNRNLRFPKWNPISANGSTVPKSTRSKCPGRTLISSCSGGKSYFEHLATKKILSPKRGLDTLTYIRSYVAGWNPLTGILEVIKANGFLISPGTPVTGID